MRLLVRNYNGLNRQYDYFSIGCIASSLAKSIVTTSKLLLRDDLAELHLHKIVIIILQLLF